MSWSESLARSLAFVALGVLVGATAAATVTLGTEGGEALFAPLGGLAGAALAHRRFRMVRMPQDHARPARLAMGTALVAMMVGLTLSDLELVGWSLWLMTSTTVIVTGMAATIPIVRPLLAAGWSPANTGTGHRLEVA